MCFLSSDVFPVSASFSVYRRYCFMVCHQLSMSTYHIFLAAVLRSWRKWNYCSRLRSRWIVINQSCTMKAPRTMALLLARVLGEVEGVGQHDPDKRTSGGSGLNNSKCTIFCHFHKLTKNSKLLFKHEFAFYLSPLYSQWQWPLLNKTSTQCFPLQ